MAQLGPLQIEVTHREASNNNNNDNDDDNDNDKRHHRHHDYDKHKWKKTYCDVPNPSNPCHDRKDFDDRTRLYTCLDGSHVKDWRECDDDDDRHDKKRDDKKDNPIIILPNCNDVEYGTHCDGTEDER